MLAERYNAVYRLGGIKIQQRTRKKGNRDTDDKKKTAEKDESG